MRIHNLNSIGTLADTETQGRREMYTGYVHHFDELICIYHMESDVVPSCGGQVRFTIKLGNSVASVNELHSEAKLLIRNKRGISARHLQGYLDWLLFRKKMKNTVEMKKWKSTAYMNLMFEQIPFTAADIEKLDMPISLYEAYGSYHFGIFSNIN